MESVNIVDATETTGARVKATTPTGAEQALCVRTVGPVEVDGVVLANIQGVAKGSTPAASVTATDVDADHTALDVHVVAGTFPLTLDPTNLALDATLTDGTLKARVHGVAKGATAAADATVSAIDADHDAIDVYVRGTTGGGLTNAELRASAVPVSAAALPLPAGAATEATLANALTTAAFQARINTQGQKAMAASTPVVIASDQSAVPIADGGGSITVDAAALPLPTGAATEATLANVLTTAAFQARINTQGQKAMAASTPVVLASDQSAVPIADGGGSITVDGPLTDAQLRAAVVPVGDGAGSLTVDSPQLPAALVGGRLDGNVGAWLGSTAPSVGSKTSANSVPVVIASDQGAVPVTATQLPAALVGGRLDNNIGAWLGSTAPTVGQKTMANSLPVAIASDQTLTLSAGTSEIGEVAQGAPAANTPANAWPVVLARDEYSSDLMSRAVDLLESLVLAQRRTNLLLMSLCVDSGVDIDTDELLTGGSALEETH